MLPVRMPLVVATAVTEGVVAGYEPGLVVEVVTASGTGAGRVFGAEQGLRPYADVPQMRLEVYLHIFYQILHWSHLLRFPLHPPV